MMLVKTFRRTLLSGLLFEVNDFVNSHVSYGDLVQVTYLSVNFGPGMDDWVAHVTIAKGSE